MPIDKAVYANTDPLKPHGTTQAASDAHTAHKYLPPGPGAYDDSKIDPSVTTKFKKTPGVSWGASRDTRFKPFSSLAPGPGNYKYDSSFEAQPNSRRCSSARPMMGKAKKELELRRGGPGPGDYRPEGAGFQSPPLSQARMAASSFGGPLGKMDRFNTGLLKEFDGRSPGPCSYSLPATGCWDGHAERTTGTPKFGTAKRYMSNKSIGTNPRLHTFSKGSDGATRTPMDATSYYQFDHDRPGPAAYSGPSAIGSQQDSRRPNQSEWKFGTSKRPSVEVTARKSPGPGEYGGANRGMLGNQPNSRVATSAQCKFGTAPRKQLLNEVG